MSALNQKESVYKTETWLNMKTLHQFQPMSHELSTLLFKDNALKKPTQHVFYQLSHYLILMIDPVVCSTLPWPLYDSKTERNYRNEFSKVIQDYSAKGLVIPVMSSYLVNPGCLKVTILIYQLSQLAIKRCVITATMNKEHQKKLYEEVTEKYNLKNMDFIENTEKQMEFMTNAFQNHLHKRQMFEKITEIFRNRIIHMEETLEKCKAKVYINNIVDNYLKKHNFEDSIKKEILKIKNVEEPSIIFEICLEDTDRKITELETSWESKVRPLVTLSQNTSNATEELLARYMGETDKKSYMLEYNHKTDQICTKDLENAVNSEQKYILKNIVQHEQLNFPNLVKAFLISTSYILKDTEISDDIYQFNQHLEEGRRNVKEMSIGLGLLVERLRNLKERVQVTPIQYHPSMPEVVEIPPLPDNSDIKFHKEHIIFDGFTPFSLSKRQFNLRRKISNNSFVKPKPRPLITPFHHQGPREDYSLVTCRFPSYDTANMSQNVNNISMISHASNQRANETISEFTSGFSKQQMQRLFSTKKTSSSKKYKYSTERPGNLKAGALFNESTSSIESNGLFRSYSSPNLYENREKRSLPRMVGRKLSIMQEDSPSSINLSGITAINNNSGTPQSIISSENNRKVSSDINLRESPELFTHIFKQVDLNKLKIDTPTMQDEKLTVDLTETETNKTETPKTNPHLIKKTSSIEKIINRFKKVRASTQADRNHDECDIQTIVEEKENFNAVNVDVFTANRVLLPDLLSPSCSILTVQTSQCSEVLNYDSDEGVTKRRKPRESLGTVLGVDHTFLDQFDLID